MKSIAVLAIGIIIGGVISHYWGRWLQRFVNWRRGYGEKPEQER